MRLLLNSLMTALIFIPILHFRGSESACDWHVVPRNAIYYRTFARGRYIYFASAITFSR